MSTLVCSQECGFTTQDENERFCPDDGAPLKSGDAAIGLSAPDLAVSTAPMPALPGAVQDTRLVIKTIGLPFPNEAGDKEVHLHEGDTFSVAREGTTFPVNFLVPADKDGAVSASDPFVLTVTNGELVAKGGGANGYKVTWVQSFVATQGTVLKALPDGQPTMTIVLGAKTPFRVK